MTLRIIPSTRSMTALYGWGHPRALPLAIAADRPFLEPVRLKVPHSTIKNETVTHIAAGYGHSLIGTSEHVYGFGLNSAGQLGCSSNGGIAMTLESQTLLGLACGREHSHILTKESGLFSMGSSMYGQLGVGKSKASGRGMQCQSTPTRVLGYEGNVMQVVCGLDNSVFCTDANKIYAMGWGADGQLGLGNGSTSDKDMPTPLPLQRPVRTLSSSTDFTLAILDDGTLWTWGNSEYGQGMQGSKIDRILEPVPIRGFNGIIDVAAGGPFSVILTEDHRVHTCGYGALGRGNDSIEALTPRQVDGLANVVRIFATTDYAAAITSSGELYTWGLNDRHGRLGTGNTDHAFTPQRIPADGKVIDVALGTYHAFAICEL